MRTSPRAARPRSGRTWGWRWRRPGLVRPIVRVCSRHAAHVLPPGMAKLIPAGWKLVFQMHYTPNGSPQKDRSSVGIKFADPAEVTYRVATANAANAMFEIPAGDPAYKVESTRTYGKDVLLLSVFPHMHLRGKDFHYEVDLSGRPQGNDHEHAAIRLQLADQLRVRASPRSCPRARRCTARRISTTRRTTRTPSPDSARPTAPGCPPSCRSGPCSAASYPWAAQRLVKDVARLPVEVVARHVHHRFLAAVRIDDFVVKVFAAQMHVRKHREHQHVRTIGPIRLDLVGPVAGRNLEHGIGGIGRRHTIRRRRRIVELDAYLAAIFLRRAVGRVVHLEHKLPSGRNQLGHAGRKHIRTRARCKAA